MTTQTEGMKAILARVQYSVAARVRTQWLARRRHFTETGDARRL
jgi:hypothetical protein